MDVIFNSYLFFIFFIIRLLENEKATMTHTITISMHLIHPGMGKCYDIYYGQVRPWHHVLSDVWRTKVDFNSLES